MEIGETTDYGMLQAVHSRTRYLARQVAIGVIGLFTAVVLAMGLVSLLGSARAVDASAELASTPDDAVTVLLELEEPPVAEIYAQLVGTVSGPDAPVTAASVAATTAAHLKLVESEQQKILDELANANLPIVYRVQRVYNGVAVRVAADEMDMLRTLPGVKATHRIVSKRPLNDRSVLHIGAPALWQRNVGMDLTGAGVTIGIVDTGIDYLHLDFGGPATGYEGNDPTRIGDVVGFPGIKVVGGYDFAGDSYNADPEASDYDPQPAPDPDPMDCYGRGHGTHVAATAAGFGVTGDRHTYKGLYSSELDFRSFAIGPGVAPHATLFAIKVFGCSGTSEIVDLGIEWAVDPNGDGDFSDHLDVINLSLGAVYGAAYDATAVAAERAAQVGVLVVASAGNDGDTFYTVSSPSVGDHVISVAAVATGSRSATQLTQLQERGTTFSSRGPRRNDSMLKPDLAAPGQSIRSAQAGSGAASYVASGTSMAAPHVSGSLALLRQLHPNAKWSATDLKALLINTAQIEIRASSVPTASFLSPVRIGGGSIDLPAALEAGAIVYNADDPGLVGVSFGAPSVIDQLHLVKNVSVENKADRPLTYTIGYSSVVDIPGVAFELPGMLTVTVPTGALITFPVAMRAVAREMDHSRDPTVGETQGLPRHWLSEEAGFLVLKPVEQGQTLHLPVYVAPHRVSQMFATTGELDFGTDEQAPVTVTLAGQPIAASETVTGQQNYTETHVSAFLLQYVSINDKPAYSEPALPPSKTDPADLKYVGTSGRYAVVDGTLGAESTVYFAVATHAPWSSPKEVEFDILIDANQDGHDDYRVYNSDSVSYIFDDLVSDAFVTIVEDFATNTQTFAGFINILPASDADTAPYNTDIMILPAPAVSIGLHEGNTAFDYRVRSYSVDIAYGVELGRYVEMTPKMYFDLAQPGLNSTDGRGPIYAGVPGSVIPLHYTAPAYARAGGQGILLFFHQNLLGEHVQVIPVQAWRRPTVYLPLIQTLPLEQE